MRRTPGTAFGGARQVGAERLSRRRAVGVGLRQRYLHRQDIARIETRTDLHQAGEALDEKAGAAQHHDRQRDFDRDQRSSRDIRHRRRATFAVAQQSLRIAAAQADQRREAEQGGGYQGRAGGEKQDAPVDGDRHFAAVRQRAETGHQHQVGGARADPRQRRARRRRRPRRAPVIPQTADGRPGQCRRRARAAARIPAVAPARARAEDWRR